MSQVSPALIAFLSPNSTYASSKSLGPYLERTQIDLAAFGDRPQHNFEAKCKQDERLDLPWDREIHLFSIGVNRAYPVSGLNLILDIPLPTRIPSWTEEPHEVYIQRVSLLTWELNSTESYINGRYFYSQCLVSTFVS